MRAGGRAALVSAVMGILLGVAARAQGAVSLVPLVSLPAPVYVTHARDARLFIVEQAGRIRIYTPGTGLLGTPFLDIQSRVLSGGERGLFSVAFHPEYATNGFFYVHYTNLAGDLVIERYHVTANPNVADPASAAQLLLIGHPTFSNHNGGQLQIGPLDGYLYIGTGDGGSGGDPACNAQRGESLLGKILRLDIRQNLNQPPFHGIPTDNPFRPAGDPAGLIRDEIWALGVRNPWRFSFDRMGGDLFVADVGQNNFEEVDLHRAGAAGGQNFGWKIMEGLGCFDTASCPAGAPPCNSPLLTLPIHQYSHSTGECSITGGYVYRGNRAPEIFGRYLFGDFCSGSIRALREIAPGNWQVTPVVQGAGGLTSFGEDRDGELYATIGNNVFRVVSDAFPAPVPVSGSPGIFTLAVLLAATGALSLARRRR